MEETIHSASEMLKQVVGYIQQDSRQKKKYRLRSSIKSLDDILRCKAYPTVERRRDNFKLGYPLVGLIPAVLHLFLSF